MSDQKERQAKIQKLAAEWLDREPLFLDTETTGLDGGAQLVELALIDQLGNVLIDTLIKPTIPIPAGATEIHGITDQMVKYAPAMDTVWADVRELCRDKLTIIYNASYDIKLIFQSLQAAGVKGGFIIEGFKTDCAMNAYAEYYGDWNNYHGNYRWQKLSAAGEHFGIRLDATLHRARADAELTRHVVYAMAGQPLPMDNRGEVVVRGTPKFVRKMHFFLSTETEVFDNEPIERDEHNRTIERRMRLIIPEDF